MKRCNEKTRQWPDFLADVSQDDMDDFLAHSEACPYHAQVLRAEEEELRSIFRLARGLDRTGRVLAGEELQVAIAEQETRLEEWKATCDAETPFGLISLYNGGSLIASCGEFLGLVEHQSLHELDPKLGLQIRARCGADEDRDVLLGFYVLSGARHEGDERLLHLDNGYTVGLKVKELVDENFQINFRCVENSVIEEELVAEGVCAKTKATSASVNAGAGVLSSHSSPADGLIPDADGPQVARGWLPKARSWQISALCFLSAALFFTSSPASALLGGSWADTEKSAAQVSTNKLWLVCLFTVLLNETAHALSRFYQTRKRSPHNEERLSNGYMKALEFDTRSDFLRNLALMWARQPC
jgi:hypothetical protein